MSFNGFDTLPDSAANVIKAWKVNIPQQDLDNLFTLLKISPLAPNTYENSLPGEDRSLGVRHDWLSAAKKYWENEFDWRKQEEHMNSFPHFKASVHDPIGEFDVHFVALFSKRKDAIPIILLHGWPGSFLEFLSILDSLRSKYTADTLPYHLVVPSLPGYTFSSPPPLNHNFRPTDVARIIDKLTTLLGFQAYMFQGGDVGGRVGRIMAAEYPNCKAILLNTCPMPAPDFGDIKSPINDSEEKGLERHRFFLHNGSAYALEHATRPATIGFVLSSSPLALLAWIGEKFMGWTDTDPSLDEILTSVTLYWVTGCAATSLWSYREFYGPNATSHATKEWHVKKPLGFSWFPREITPVPRAWVELTGNLVFYRQHDSGGHFAAMEKPSVLWNDVEEFLNDVKGVFDTR
ncbi:alpha/beta-hydrolase [Rhizodiscina lignyota]|uniref:Alpha/beta-hydrolase n=1 Tax=Rhizodiscina lignyota TaxID=1504668 RepID=A0A9P4MBA7_9PEZI|nr:alpha/beta-hydrolase [Rhizodiscina lignyota]